MNRKCRQLITFMKNFEKKYAFQLKSQFDLILNKCQAFDHCTYIIDYYYNFKTGLKEQINKLDPNTRVIVDISLVIQITSLVR